MSYRQLSSYCFRSFRRLWSFKEVTTQRKLLTSFSYKPWRVPVRTVHTDCPFDEILNSKSKNSGFSFDGETNGDNDAPSTDLPSNGVETTSANDDGDKIGSKKKTMTNLGKNDKDALTEKIKSKLKVILLKNYYVSKL